MDCSHRIMGLDLGGARRERDRGRGNLSSSFLAAPTIRTSGSARAHSIDPEVQRSAQEVPSLLGRS